VLKMAKGSVKVNSYSSIEVLMHWIDEVARVVNDNITMDL